MLDWGDRITASRSFFSDLARSPVKHLNLFIDVDKGFELDPDSLRPNGTWPLSTLYLDLASSTPAFDSVSISRLSHSILRACAPTLQDLVWHRSDPGFEEDEMLSSQVRDIHFPKLRRLKLGGLLSSDLSLFDKTFRSENECNIHSWKLTLVTVIWRIIVRLPHWTLSSGIYSDTGAKIEFGFLKSNPQLTKLPIPWHLHPADITKVLSILSRLFPRLRSLRLTWKGTFIPEDALRLVGTITSLEQICLTAGRTGLWNCDFRIDHDAMRRNLAPLRNLRKIAFDRDTYDIGVTKVHPMGSPPMTIPACAGSRITGI